MIMLSNLSPVLLWKNILHFAINLAITIGTIPIRDNIGASRMNSNSEVVISVQPGTEPALTRAQIEGVTPMPAPTAPNLSADSNEPSTSGTPSAPPAPIDFSDSEFHVLLFQFYFTGKLLQFQEKYSISDPPTYEEAMHMHLELENSNNFFKPKYPMFKRQTSYSVFNN